MDETRLEQLRGIAKYGAKALLDKQSLGPQFLPQGTTPEEFNAVLSERVEFATSNDKWGELSDIARLSDEKELRLRCVEVLVEAKRLYTIVELLEKISYAKDGRHGDGSKEVYDATYSGIERILGSQGIEDDLDLSDLRRLLKRDDFDPNLRSKAFPTVAKVLKKDDRSSQFDLVDILKIPGIELHIEDVAHAVLENLANQGAVSSIVEDVIESSRDMGIPESVKILAPQFLPAAIVEEGKKRGCGGSYKVLKRDEYSHVFVAAVAVVGKYQPELLLNVMDVIQKNAQALLDAMEILEKKQKQIETHFRYRSENSYADRFIDANSGTVVQRMGKLFELARHLRTFKRIKLPRRTGGGGRSSDLTITDGSLVDLSPRFPRPKILSRKPRIPRTRVPVIAK